MTKTNTTKTQLRKLKRPTRTPQKHNTEGSKDQHEHHKNTTQKAQKTNTNTTKTQHRKLKRPTRTPQKQAVTPAACEE
jgi:hypothetical protein